ncbi:MAG: ATP-binding protein, partial [Phycisphaerales bacterium JB064]
EAIEGLGLPEGGVPEGDLHLLGELANEALAIERQMGDARREADRAQAEVEAIGGDAVPMDADTLARLDQALDAVQRTRERQNIDREAAEDWTPPQTEAPSRVLPAAVAVTALLTAIAALLAAAWIAVGLAVITMALAFAHLIRRPAPPTDAMPQLRQRAEQSERAHAEAIARLREIVGEDSELQSTLSLVTAAKRAERQDKLVRDLHAARAGVESLQQQLADVLQRARSVLGTRCDSTDELSRSLADLRHKTGEHRRLHGIESEAIERQAESKSRARKAQGDYEAFLEYLKLTEDRLSELQEWLRLREHARALAGQIRANEAVLQRMEASLAEATDLREVDKPALESMLDACRAAGSEADALHREIGEIEGAVKRARQGADVGRAIAGYERAAEVVADARDHECAKAARRLILDHASTGMEREDMPALLKSADDLMATFTNKAYGLTVNAESQPVVRDHRTGMVKAYDQLSTGTRAQALLAMRLASAMEAEKRAGATALPLVLDEPLATTDDERFEVIAKAMFALAGDGRQLIYLTCEPAHAERLQRLAASHGLDCIRHDLDAIRGRQRTLRNPANSLVEPKPLPSPETLSREAYLDARGVDPLDPWASTDAIDLYHLLTGDLSTLHQLDQSGLGTVGQVLAERRRLGDAFAWPEVARSADIASRLVHAWRKGRARPLTSQDLIDSGAVTDSFLERLAELNNDLGGSATKLVEAIEERADDRVKGFRSDKARALRDYLEGSALLPTEPTMARAEMLDRALSGLENGVSAQYRDNWLALANRLLNQLDAMAESDREAPAHLEA